jgi:hypothetical protein
MQVSDVSQVIIAAGEELAPDARAGILTLGGEAVEPLLEFIRDEAWADADGPGGGWAPIHAARLLGELKAPQAIEPMLEALWDCEAGEDILFDALMLGLAKIGPAVLEPALRARDATDEPEMRSQLATILAELGVRDERIYQALLEQLEDEPGLGAGSLQEYGDERAVEPLSAMLDELDANDPEEHVDVVECAAAIESLGGTLTPGQKAKAAEVEKSWKRAYSLRRLRDTGRNDACPCGSGKKYKKCHLPIDEQTSA